MVDYEQLQLSSEVYCTSKKSQLKRIDVSSPHLTHGARCPKNFFLVFQASHPETIHFRLRGFHPVLPRLFMVHLNQFFFSLTFFVTDFAEKEEVLIS